MLVPCMITSQRGASWPRSVYVVKFKQLWFGVHHKVTIALNSTSRNHNNLWLKADVWLCTVERLLLVSVTEYGTWWVSQLTVPSACARIYFEEDNCVTCVGAGQYISLLVLDLQRRHWKIFILNATVVVFLGKFTIASLVSFLLF